MDQRTQRCFIARNTGSRLKIVVILLSFFIWTQTSRVSYAQKSDLILTKRLTNGVMYDQIINVPSKCHCRVTCIARPGCTAASYYIDDSGQSRCRYSNSQLEENNLNHDISATTFLRSGVLDSALTENLQEVTYNYYIASKNTGCEKPFVKVQGTSDCVFLANEKKTWSNAKEVCETINSHLYVALTTAEFDALRSHLGGMDTPSDIWVSVKDRIWNDGRVVDPLEWQPNSPNGDVSECARLKSSQDFKLDDRGCGTSYAFLCQRVEN